MIWDGLAILSAAFNALGSVLQRRGAARAPAADAMRLRLVLDLARSPATVGGIGAMIVGVALQAAALHGAPLTLVEPILVVELPLTLLLAARVFGARVERRTWGAIVLSAASLAAFLLLASPSGGGVRRVSTLAWAATLVCTVTLVAGLIALALRADGTHRAILLGVAAGAGHGLSATLMKATTVAAAHGVAAAFGAWQLYAMVIAGGVSVYLYQNALQAGTLVAAQPALNVTDPGVSVCFGVLLYGEHVRGGFYVIPEVAAMAALVPALVVLARASAPSLAAGARERRAGASAHVHAHAGR
ncbi:MAG TPA: DMT family transporter [Solirubrobacteraceae bacterium]|nr:DMT family transporter [Solirubrobacteraceae bacterium]